MGGFITMSQPYTRLTRDPNVQGALMKPRITMRDVARAAGVSPMTVSRALRENSDVNIRTRAGVRAAAARLGYIYDTTAQAFRAQRSGCIAITLPSINNANFAATHRALTTTLDSTPLQLLLGITGYSLREEERLIRQLLARRPEAVVLTGGTHSEQTRDLLQSSDIPVIEIWDQPRTALAHSAGFSNAQAMRPVVEHLAQTGRRRLAFLGASGDSDPRGDLYDRRGGGDPHLTSRAARLRSAGLRVRSGGVRCIERLPKDGDRGAKGHCHYRLWRV